MGFKGCDHRFTPKEISQIKRHCGWVKEIRFSAETKQWLKGLKWPQSAYKDFNKIRNFNIKVTKFCKKF